MQFKRRLAAAAGPTDRRPAQLSERATEQLQPNSLPGTLSAGSITPGLFCCEIITNSLEFANVIMRFSGVLPN